MVVVRHGLARPSATRTAASAATCRAVVTAAVARPHTRDGAWRPGLVQPTGSTILVRELAPSALGVGAAEAAGTAVGAASSSAVGATKPVTAQTSGTGIPTRMGRTRARGAVAAVSESRAMGVGVTKLNITVGASPRSPAAIAVAEHRPGRAGTALHVGASLAPTAASRQPASVRATVSISGASAGRLPGLGTSLSHSCWERGLRVNFLDPMVGSELAVDGKPSNNQIPDEKKQGYRGHRQKPDHQLARPPHGHNHIDHRRRQYPDSR